MGEEQRANPFFGIQLAMTKVDPTQPFPSPDHMRAPASAKLKLDDLLKGYTITAAKQMHWENMTGSLEEGKYADYIVLPRNLYKMTAEEIGETLPEETVFKGKTVYKA